MATPTTLSREFRSDQIELARDTTRRLLEISGSLNFKAIDSSSDGWMTAVESVVASRFDQSVDRGTAMYQDYRTASGVSGAAPTVAPVLDKSGLRGALTLTGPYAAKHAMATGVSIRTAFESIFANTTGAAVRAVLGGGRDVIQGTANADPVCTGYMRVTSGNPCNFCAMVAANTYNSVESASQSSGTRTRAKNPQPPKSRYHSHCRCTVVPIFTASSWPAGYKAQASDYNDLYQEVSRAGGTAKEKEERFFAAFNARFKSS